LKHPVKYRIFYGKLSFIDICLIPFFFIP